MSVSVVESPSRGIKLAWAVQVVLAAVFLAAAGAKLASVPMLVEEFDTIGFGQWFRYVTACVEIIGAIALLMPGLAGLGALWLGTTMVCATLTHLFILHNNPAPAIILFALNLLVLWLRRGQLGALRARFA